MVVEERANEHDLAQRLSRLAAGDEGVAEEEWVELAAIERRLWAELAREGCSRVGPVRGHPVQQSAQRWGRALLRAGLGGPAAEVDRLVAKAFDRRVEEWRAGAAREELPARPDAWFRQLVEVSRLRRAARRLGALSGWPDLERDRAELRSGLVETLRRHPPERWTRRRWTDWLVDGADEVLSAADELPPAGAAEELAEAQADLAWHMDAVEVERGVERRRLARRVRRLRAERSERLLSERLERRFGARLVAWWERGILLAILAVLVLMSVPFAFDLTPAQERAVLLVDAVLCALFLWDFVFKLATVRGDPSWFRRHLLTDLLPALPFPLLLLEVPAGAPGAGHLPGVGAQQGRSILLLRLVRLPRLARYVRLLLPAVRAARAAGFLLRGLDRLVRQYGGLLDREVILYPTPAERRRASAASASRGSRLQELRRELDHLWHASLESVRADARRAERLAAARLGALRAGVAEPFASLPLASTATHARSDLCAEDLLERLSGVVAEEIEGELGNEVVARAARAARALARSPLRWLPILARLVRRVDTDAPDAEVTAAVTRNGARWLFAHLRRIQWVADLHGTVTPSDLVGRVGTTLVRRTARPAMRLALLGGAYVALALFAHLFGLELGRWVQHVSELIGTALLVLGSVCFLLLGLGFWLQRVASDASIFFEQVASAQFLHLTDSLKMRDLERDAELFEVRVFAPERELRGEARRGPDGDRRAFLDGVRRWLLEGAAAEGSGAGFDAVARAVLLYRDAQDGALLAETDTRGTSQLLGNLALRRARTRSGRIGRREERALEKLDLERRRTLVRGPYLWFHCVARAVTQHAARLIVDYNEHAVPLGELALLGEADRERHRAWLASRSARPEELITGAEAARRDPLTSAFTALHFLDDDPGRDAAVERRFGPEVLALLRRDRRSLFRRVFGTYPLHVMPAEERVLNLRELYRHWIEGGRVALLPLRLVLRGLHQAGRCARVLGRSVRSIRDPRLAYACDERVESDFATAARKIDRMRRPFAEACLWQRALVDVEYLGLPLPGRLALPGSARGGPAGPAVEADLDFLGAPHELRARVQEERRRAAADVRRLARLLDEGLVARAAPRLGARSAPGGEHLRSLAAAYRADDRGLRSLLSAAEICREVVGAARERAPLPPRGIARPGLRRAFRAWWREHGGGGRAARTRAWRAVVHDVDGVAGAMLAWSRHGDATEERGRELAADVLAHAGQGTEQIVTLRAVQTLSLVDLRNYRAHVWRLGAYGASGEEPARALAIQR